ncbi:MAG: PRTRC system protein E [Tannerellaceae bacterium]|nr:PRTRC system protein E [Tannerellaceae bacterium]
MFFTELNNLLAAGQSVTITIHKTAVNMTVSVLPKDTRVKDPAVKNLKSFDVTATAEELDAEFLNELKKPLMKSTGLLSNLVQFEQGITDTEKNSKVGKEKEEKVKKLIEIAEALEQEKKKEEAFAKYKEVLEVDPHNHKVLKKTSELEKELKQPSLF